MVLTAEVVKYLKKVMNFSDKLIQKMREIPDVDDTDLKVIAEVIQFAKEEATEEALAETPDCDCCEYKRMPQRDESRD